MLQASDMIECVVDQGLSDGSKDEAEIINELRRNPVSPPLSPIKEIAIPPVVVVAALLHEENAIPMCNRNENEKSLTNVIGVDPVQEVESKAMQTAKSLFGVKMNNVMDQTGSDRQAGTSNDAEKKVKIQKRSGESQSVIGKKKSKTSEREASKTKAFNQQQQNKITSFFDRGC
jgi:hypothetical protein